MEVGGDFFDFFMIGEGKVGMIIGDVTGKSVSGALVMTASKSVFRLLSEEQMSVGEIMKRAKIERFLTRTTKDGAARDTAKRSFHSLRHTFTTWLASESVPEEVRRKMTGHTSTRSHQQYTHHELETLKGAVEKLPGLNKKKRA